MKILKMFFLEKGWLHLICMFFAIYILIYWANSEYCISAVKMKLEPSTMLYGLKNSSVWFQMFIYSVIGAFIGYVIEWHQEKYFESKFSVADIVFTTLGAPTAIGYYEIFGQQIVLFFVCVSCLILVIGSAVRLVVLKLKKG